MTRLKFILLIVSVLGSLSVFSKASGNPLFKAVPGLAINANDSIIFDLASATVTATYVDLPIYVRSDDVIFGIDFAIQFNLSKLTYSTVISLMPPDPTLTYLAHFNTNDLFLRYTGGSTMQSFPSNGDVHVAKVRFALSGPCLSLSASDITQVKAYLNGVICSYRVSKLDFTKFIPVAGFSNGPTCMNTGIQFSDLSTVSSGTVTSWSWSFNNGSTSTQQNPLATYSNTGAATATLIVTSSSGCQDTLVKPLTINDLPVPGFSYAFNCVKDSVFFTNSSAIPAGTIAGSQWDFGDLAGSSNLSSPAYHYNASGIYTVTLVSTSGFSCVATKTLLVSLNNKVSADFSTTGKNCAGSQLSFSDASTYSLNPIGSWSWSFGDGNSSVQQNPAHTFSTSGTYSVTLTSTGTDGCKGFITQSVVIAALPVVQFGASTETVCSLNKVTFGDLSSTIPGSTYSWSFGDGATSALQNPLHTYSTIAVYAVRLLVITPAGCRDSLIKQQDISFPEPGPAVFTETVVSNGLVQFSNLTPNSERAEWSFGDSRSSKSQNPSHVFPGIQTYEVCLVSYDSLDCPTSLCKDIYVGFARIVAVPSGFTPNKDNNNDVLRVLGGPLAEMQLQIFNQWGNLLFTSTSQDTGWDGTFNAEPQPAGVYEYILNAKTLDNKVISVYGAVNLSR